MFAAIPTQSAAFAVKRVCYFACEGMKNTILVQGLHKSDIRDNKHDGLRQMFIFFSHRHTYVHTYIFGVNGRGKEKRG
jgi:hypothetical protein